MLGFVLVFWLLPGPRMLGHAVIDVHTMLFGMVFTLTGTQIIAIGLFAKVYSFAERLAPKQRSLERWLRRIKLEEGLAFGTVITLFGAGGIAWVVYQWVRSDFGPLIRISRRDFLLVVVFAGNSDCSFVIFSQYAGNQPRNVYRGLRQKPMSIIRSASRPFCLQ